ncbi:hypothetical protein ACIP9X_18625 [Arthrobacter sp. NPDC093125]|uniref:hypothetical protein n=1 Tax=Arthrobacter sp. NPDC093125 TaxID=3363944 RepID=UPI0038050194
MRDSASEFEVFIRILPVELQTTGAQAFIQELFAWRTALVRDCQQLPELPPEADRSSAEIKALRMRTDAFVEYLDDWLHVPDRELGDYSEQMRKGMDPPLAGHRSGAAPEASVRWHQHWVVGTDPAAATAGAGTVSISRRSRPR